MLGFSKKSIDPLQPAATGVASDAMPMRRPDERDREEESAAVILARLERYTASLIGRPRPVGNDRTAATITMETSQPPWPADTFLPQPVRHGSRLRGHRSARATTVDSPAASIPDTASEDQIQQPIRQARHRPRMVLLTGPRAVAVLSSILAIVAFERLDDPVAAALSAGLSLVGVIASYDEYHEQRLGRSAASPQACCTASLEL